MCKIKKCIIKKVIYVVSALLLGTILSSCMQSNAATTGSEISTSAIPQKVITDNTLKVVNAVFYQTFFLGDWRYKGA